MMIDFLFILGAISFVIYCAPMMIVMMDAWASKFYSWYHKPPPFDAKFFPGAHFIIDRNAVIIYDDVWHFNPTTKCYDLLVEPVSPSSEQEKGVGPEDDKFGE